MERIRKGLKNMIIVKAVRTVFIAQGHIDFGGTPNDRTITKEFIYDSEKTPSSKDLLNFSNRNIEHVNFNKIVSRETYEIKLSMTFNEFYKIAHENNIKKTDIEN